MVVLAIFLALSVVAAFSGLSIILKRARHQQALEKQTEDTGTVKAWLQVNNFPLNDDGTLDPDVKREDGMPCLIHALKTNHEIADLLLKFGANPNARTEDGTPAVVAVTRDGPARMGISTVLAMLLEYGPDVNAMDNWGKTALFYAKQCNIQSLLLEAGALVNARDIYGKTPLFYTQDRSMLALLLAHGAEPNAQDCDGKTILFYMDSEDVLHRETARMLFDFYAFDSGICDNEGNRAPIVVELKLKRRPSIDLLRKAISCGNVEQVDSLLKAGANPNATDKDGKSLLRSAINCANNDVLRCLLEAGADPNQNVDDETIGSSNLDDAAAEALFGCKLEAFETLLKYGCILNSTCINKLRFTDINSEYFRAAASAPSAYQTVESDVFDKFLSCCSNLKARDHSGKTFLHYLAANLDLGLSLDDRIEKLVRKGVDVNATDENGATPLFYARSAAAVRALVKCGAKPGNRDFHGRTPLFYLSHNAWYAGEVVQALLEAGVDRNAMNKAHQLAPIQDKIDELLRLLPLNRALDRAVNNDQLDLARELLVAGASPDIRHVHQYRWNMLMLAISKSALRMVSLLVDYGADPNDYVDGKTAFRMAIISKNKPCIQLFIDLGVIPDNETRLMAKRFGVSIKLVSR